MTASHSSSLMLNSMRSRRMPALFTTMSTAPNSLTTLATSRSAARKSATLSWFPAAVLRRRPPAALTAGPHALAGDARLRAAAVDPAPEVVHPHARALRREQLRDRPPDAAAGSGDHRALPGKTPGHHCASFRRAG